MTCLNSYLLDADIENPQAEYAWYIDNTLIPGEINPTLNVIQNGNYRVEITVPINNTRCLIEDQIQEWTDGNNLSKKANQFNQN